MHSSSCKEFNPFENISNSKESIVRQKNQVKIGLALPQRAKRLSFALDGEPSESGEILSIEEFYYDIKCLLRYW